MLNVDRRLDRLDPKLLALMRRLAAGESPWPLYLHGAPGRGKTCAALAMADVIETAMFTTCEDLTDGVMGDNATAMWESVRVKHLAILDELGARERMNDLHYSAVKRFADLREQHAGRVAIYIGNVTPEELPGLYDDRLASRILCGMVYRLEGDDRRHSA
jgi:chromosomal replication initiation ATPase DnaA